MYQCTSPLLKHTLRKEEVHGDEHDSDANQKVGGQRVPKQCGREQPCSSTGEVHMHMSSESKQHNNSVHAPVKIVARVLLYFFKIVSANLKKKLLNTP